MLFSVIKALAVLLCFDSLVEGNLANEHSKINDPPCFFNPLCTCSKAFPDLGRVTCTGIPLVTVPQQINTSKVFMLHLEDNGLLYLEPHFFRHTGLFGIEISENLLSEIKEETFSGLEISLWELNLRRNKFRRVPNQSFRSLQKLKLLDLSGNEITNVEADDWLGLENSLKTLILSDNELSTLRPRTFSKLQQLQSLDLSGNSLFEFDAYAFKEGPPMLGELLLADNLLSGIPFQELSELRKLRHLDLSFNQITEVQELSHERSKTTPINLPLDTLRLDYNQIQYLPAEAFKSFPTLNSSYLNGNPIRYVEKNAFQLSKVRELYFKDCEISDLAVDALYGIRNYLEVLDLEGNNLTALPSNFLEEFTLLKSFSLKNNVFKEIDLDKTFVGDRFSLEQLDVTDMENAPTVEIQTLNKLPNLRSLALSRFPQPSLSANDFPDSLTELEEIKISYSNIKNLKSHAFKNVRGLKKLDLTENEISTVEDKAFAEIGHSLIQLTLANGLSSSLTQLSPRVFQDLTAVEHLDLSNNHLKNLPQNLFRSMKRLIKILIQDNFIESIPRRLFQEDVHSQLNSIQLSFNQLSSIESQSFTDLNKLEYLWLNDNRITTIERKAFANLPNLKYLYLQGNKLIVLKEESFHHLPQLEKLDLTYNKIQTFRYSALDQVGTLSSFSLNLSHNALQRMTANVSRSDHPDFAVFHSVNIKALDLSYNNISFIEPGFFKVIESSVTRLFLHHNRLLNLTRSVFEGLMHLQWLDISYNELNQLEADAFTNTQNIQVLHLSNNRLQEIPKNFLKGFHRLRILNLSKNNLHALPHNLFSESKIERLDISNNQLGRVPISSFDADSAYFLSELDLSDNAIVTLPSSDAFAAFKNLYRLDLSKNRLIRIEDGTFSYLRHLHLMDLSHNSDLSLSSKGLTFHGLEDVLENLVVKNLSLSAMPTLHLSSLKTLDVGGNDILTVPFEFFHNLSQLERIELSDNALVGVPPGISALNKLRYLGLSENPLKSISFQQSFTLKELDLRNTSISAMEKGALGKLPLLKKLKLTISGNHQKLNLPNLLKNNYGLTDLHVGILENEDFMEDKFKGTFSPKLKNLILSGRGLKALPRNLLQGIRSPHLNLVIFNTSIQEIGEEVFDNAEKVRNLTLDVRSNKLKTVLNPNTGDVPNAPKKTFLLELQMADNDWICDCSVGWIEVWERKKRHYLCEDNSEDCFLASDDLRTTICSNQKPKTLIEVFKQDLECGWNDSENMRASLRLVFLSASTFLILFLYKY